MAFRFYITDLMAGEVVGTDHEETAISFAQTEDAFVVDTQTGEWLTTSQNEVGYERKAIKKQKDYNLADDQG